LLPKRDIESASTLVVYVDIAPSGKMQLYHLLCNDLYIRFAYKWQLRNRL